MAETAPVLHADSLIAISPVTLDGDGNPSSYGVPMYIKLGDLAAWVLEQDTPAEE